MTAVSYTGRGYLTAHVLLDARAFSTGPFLRALLLNLAGVDGEVSAPATLDSIASADGSASAVEGAVSAIDSLPTSTPAPTTAPPTTAPTPAVPAAPDASRYVAAFGDMGVVSLPAGDPGVVAVVATGAALDRSGSLPIVVRNNTANVIGRIEVTGIARDTVGTLSGSGSSQGFQPARVEPGEIAWGYVYFGDITGEGLTFDLSASSVPPDTYFAPVVGVLTNTLDAGVSGPISVDGICFAMDGTLLGTVNSYAEQDELTAGGTGSFSLDLYGDPCPIGLVGASGYGS